jgi:hypothetical protein
MRRAAVVVLALLLPACAAGQDPTVDAGGGTSAATSASTSTPTSSAPPATDSPVAPPISTPAVEPRAYLTAVRAAAADQSGASRVVFEFDPVVPGYTIDYVQRPVTEDGSGDEVTVKGEAVLQVRFENAAGARIEGEKVISTYTGPDRVPATGAEGVVTEVVDAGDFEGAVTWVIGLRRRAPALSVSTLTSPSRLVIDVPAP